VVALAHEGWSKQQLRQTSLPWKEEQLTKKSKIAFRSYFPGTVLAAADPHLLYCRMHFFCQACHKERLALHRRCLESLLDFEAATDTPAVKAPVGTAATTSVALIDLESMQV